MRRRSAPSPERVPYGDHGDQFVERFGTGERVVALLHGGFWRARYSCELEHGVARDLAARGFTAINVEYRRGAGWPAMAQDVRTALEASAPATVIGHSAGGQLAFWAAAEGLVAAAVAQAGVLDLRAAARLRLSRGAVHELVGPVIPVDADPAQRRPLGARLLCVHGGRDDTVPVAFSNAWEGEADVVVVESEDHYAHLDPASRCWAAVTQWI